MGPVRPASRRGSACFVRMSFALRGAPCGDDAHPTLPVDGDDDEESTARSADADRDDAILSHRVLVVRPEARERIEDDGARFLERHPMFGEV